MQDPLITIRKVLYDNWDLTGDLAKANITFSTGWYDEDIKSPQVTVTNILDDPKVWELGYGTLRWFCIYQVDVWVIISRTTARGPGMAKKYIWDMKEKMRSILKANVTGLTDLKYVILNSPGRSIPETNRTPPILRFSQDIAVIYET